MLGVYNTRSMALSCLPETFLLNSIGPDLRQHQDVMLNLSAAARLGFKQCQRAQTPKENGRLRLGNWLNQ